MPKIDPKRPVFTRSGEPVEIISTAGRSPDGDHRPLIGYVADDRDTLSWSEYGKFAGDAAHVFDLVQPCELWVNIYESCTATFPTKDAALRATKQPIARIKVAYTPGQFD